MSIELSVFTGGLVFEVTPRLDAEQLERLLVPLLAEQGQTVDMVSSVGEIGLQVTCKNLLLWFNLENRSYASPRLRVTVQPLGSPGDSNLQASNFSSTETAKAVLATTLALLARELGAHTVNWLGKDMTIPAEDFVEAALPVTPRRVPNGKFADRRRRDRLAPGEVTLESFPVSPRRIDTRPARTPRPSTASGTRQIGLDFSHKLRALRKQEEDIADAIHAQVSVPLRLSAWIMTILVGIFSGPLAWVLFAFNLNRGGDFRVTANVLAATAGLSLLHAAGATQILLTMIFN